MCGRYAITHSADTLRRLFKTSNSLVNLEARYNAAPGQSLPVVRLNPNSGERSLDLLRWGLVPRKASDPSIGTRLINARMESIDDKPMYQEPFRERRGLIPATAFYEWQKHAGRNRPFAIALTDDVPMAIAGLWEIWHGIDKSSLRTFVIITTAPNELMAPIHNRMPAILPPSAWPTWLGETQASSVERKALLRPYPSDAMRIWRVGFDVGNVRNDHQDLLAPLLNPTQN